MNNVSYTVNEKSFYNPYLAFLYCSDHKINDIPKFNFMPGVFDLANIEPDKSFTELCDLRATQLRKIYDKIVLSFSGGTDSFTMYNAFIRNNLLIDEIICYYMEVDCGHDKSSADWLVENHKDIRTTIVIIENNKDIPPEEYLDDDWIFTKTSPKYRYRITAPGIPDFIQRKYEDTNYALITGFEKPNLVLHNNQWFMTFIDKTYSYIIGHDRVEMFFVSEDLPQLHIKQCHMLVRFLENMLRNVSFTHLGNPYGTTDSTGNTHFYSPFDYNINYNTWAEACGRIGEASMGNSYKQKKLNKQSIIIDKTSVMNLCFNKNLNTALFTEHLLDKKTSAIRFANGMRNLHSNIKLYEYLIERSLLSSKEQSIVKDIHGLASPLIWLKDKV